MLFLVLKFLFQSLLSKHFVLSNLLTFQFFWSVSQTAVLVKNFFLKMYSESEPTGLNIFVKTPRLPIIPKNGALLKQTINCVEIVSKIDLFGRREKNHNRRQFVISGNL